MTLLQFRFIKKTLALSSIIYINMSPDLALSESLLFDYHPNSTFALGRGFEPNTLTETKLNCVDFDRKADITGDAATTTIFNMRVVSSSEDLKRALGIDYSLDARYLQTKGNANFNLNNESAFGEKTLNVVILASSEFGTWSMSNPRLTPYAQSLINNVRHDVFRSECGSHFVTHEVLGVKTAILLTIRNLSNTFDSKVKNHVGFNYSSGEMSVDFKNEVNSVVNQAYERGSLEITIFTTGGSGVKDLKDIVSQISSKKSALDNIQTELGKYLEKFNAQNAVPVRFMAKPFGFGFENAYENIWKAHNERKIQRIAAAYRKLDNQIETAKNIYKGDDLRRLILSNTEADALYKQALIAEDYLDGLTELHRSCQYNVYKDASINKEDTSTKPVSEYCKFEEDKIPRLEIPTSPEVPILIGGSDGDKMDYSQIILSGVGISKYTIFLQRENKIQKVASSEFAMPYKLESVQIPIGLEKYWRLSKTSVKGGVRGFLTVEDYFGRRTIFTFHRAVYPEMGGKEPYSNEFYKKGEEI